MRPDGEWVDLVEGVTRIRALGNGPPPKLTHGICQACRVELLAEDAQVTSNE